MDKIDFVVTWVDGNDPEWLAERAKYMPKKENSGNSENRFRDWGLMRYWFRGVEKFAPWVNHIYFITWGHVPEWLNLEHEKLKIVKHSDYIPAEYLPTFNSNVIELNLHRIPELSEQFVLFNDDMFLLDHVTEKDFFRKGLPCDTARLSYLHSAEIRDVFPHTILNCTTIINKHFIKREVLRKNWLKFFSLQYGMDCIRNILHLTFKNFSSFYDLHLPTSHLKSTFFEVWNQEACVLKECGIHRFRTQEDVMHWLMKYWRFCKGEFMPRSVKWGRCFEIGNDDCMCDAIRKQMYKACCLNDSYTDIDFAHYKELLVDAFETVLPEKSKFEK